MSYTQYTAMVITTLLPLPGIEDYEKEFAVIDNLRSEIVEILARHGITRGVVGEICFGEGGVASFLVAPDGIEKGAGPTKAADEARDEIRKLIRTKHVHNLIDWVQVSFGGDFPDAVNIDDHNRLGDFKDPKDPD